MQDNGCEVRFQLDSGADVNTICQKLVKKFQVKSSSQKLILWNKSKVRIDVIVVLNDFSCLLGLKTVQEIGLFTINKENFIQWSDQWYKSVRKSGRKLWNLPATQNRNQKETLRQHEEGETPWSKIGVDLFEMKGRNYLVTVDYYSNFLEVDYLLTTTTKQVITKLKGHFVRYGIPLQMVTDSGPQFLSREFRNFTTEWAIQHVTSSP